MDHATASMPAGAIPEQPAPSPSVAAFLTRAPRVFIGGTWDGSATQYLPVVDPSTGLEIATIVNADQALVDRAVAAARQAFEHGPWPQMAPSAREALLWRLSDLVDRHADELAEIESLDNGKTRVMAGLIDIPASRDYLRYMAGWATKIEGGTFETSIPHPQGRHYHTYTVREPVGVVAQIVPWNFPLLMAIWKIAPALAVGCTVVLKPAEQTSLSSLRLADLIQEAGFPPGVVNILTGTGAVTGAALVAHPGVDKIAFTGSTTVGKQINRSATDTIKRVSLELGGKSPVIVLPDADLDTVIGGAAQAIFFNAGQVCTAGSRLYAHRSVFDRLIEGVSAAAESMLLGPSLHPDSQMGPLVSRQQQERVLGYIASGRAEGAAVMTGGDAPAHAGYFVKPTLLVNVKPGMRVMQEEIFGPVLVAQRFDDVDELAVLANDTPYGLSASVWSNDLSAVHRLVPKLRAGTVWVNCHNMVDPNMPFGGFKQSGFGREHGRSAIDLYSELKSVCMLV